MASALAAGARRARCLGMRVRCALQPFSLTSPPHCRAVFVGDTGNFGKFKAPENLSNSSPTGRRRDAQAPVLGSRGGTPGQLAPSTPHLQALQRISEMLPVIGDGAGIMQNFRDRQVRLRKKKDLSQQEEIFGEAVKFLMIGERWTYGNMLAYQRKVLDLMGAHSFMRRFQGDDPSVAHLEKELRVLEAMTPVELASNHKSIFTKEVVKLIAEKSGATVKFVDQVILEHDILRADRRWYQILKQFDRPMPQSFEDRSFMAEYDRPFSNSEIDYRQEMMDKHQEKQGTRMKPKRIHAIWYRHPTCGGNRWSARPPRWYPVNWKTRPERRSRLAGVGISGGGGDRGRPWGRLGNFVGPAGQRP
mmetsp:Transcript_67374/g.121404  ORF Transcript_67374/g.121404 Transcript_67374/m.121404 type:complete len:361 (-) Transcript_67374:70-1152(-)